MVHINLGYGKLDRVPHRLVDFFAMLRSGRPLIFKPQNALHTKGVFVGAITCVEQLSLNEAVETYPGTKVIHFK